MKYIVLFIVFIGIHTSCSAGCFHAKDGVLIIDSLVKRWKYFEQNEIIDSLKNIGVTMSVGKPYKVGFTTFTDIFVEECSYRGLYKVNNFKIFWSISRSKTKTTEHKSGFSFEVENIASNLERWHEKFPSIHPFITTNLWLRTRYGDATYHSHEYATVSLDDENLLISLLQRIRKQDIDKIKKDKVEVRWFEETKQKGKSFIYDVEIISTAENLLEFRCHWSKLLK